MALVVGVDGGIRIIIFLSCLACCLFLRRFEDPFEAEDSITIMLGIPGTNDCWGTEDDGWD